MGRTEMAPRGRLVGGRGRVSRYTPGNDLAHLQNRSGRLIRAVFFLTTPSARQLELELTRSLESAHRFRTNRSESRVATRPPRIERIRAPERCRRGVKKGYWKGTQ